MKNLTDQQKGSLLAFVAVMFITPDSLFIRLSNVDTWGLVFYRGMIPFVTVFIGMLIIYRSVFFKSFAISFEILISLLVNFILVGFAPLLILLKIEPFFGTLDIAPHTFPLIIKTLLSPLLILGRNFWHMI